jgi:RNA recognition motif-containing protein
MSGKIISGHIPGGGFFRIININMNIFVANLSFQTKEEELKKLFEDFGEVESVKIITDRYSDRSKGYGFVEMPVEEEAIKAIESLNEKEMNGRNIVVKKANPRND